MEYAVFLIFLLVMFTGLVSILFGFPGNFLILAASALYGWYGGFEVITLGILLVLTLLAIVGEVLEFAMGVRGLRKHRSSTRAIIGSIVGGILGAFWGAPFLMGFGSVMGALIGVFTGSFIAEYVRIRDISQALQSGFGHLARGSRLCQGSKKA